MYINSSRAAHLYMFSFSSVLTGHIAIPYTTDGSTGVTHKLSILSPKSFHPFNPALGVPLPKWQGTLYIYMQRGPHSSSPWVDVGDWVGSGGGLLSRIAARKVLLQ